MAIFHKNVSCLEMKVNFNLTAHLSFWSALKLRLAGKNYEIVARGLLEEFKKGMQSQRTDLN